jgi:hypothetical protein
MMKRAIPAILLVALGSHAMATQAMERGTFRPPNRHGYSYDHAWDVASDGNDVKKTHFVLYKNAAGDSIFSATTNGHLWAWSLETHGSDHSDHHRNYVIRDSHCNGIFDETYALDEKFYVPDCAKKNANKK